MKRAFWLCCALGAVSVWLLTACSSEIRPANVTSVTVEDRDGAPVAVVQGEHPDACAQIGASVQTVDDNTIKVGLVLAPTPPDMICAQVITPYTEVIALDTEDLPPGPNQVNVNGVTAPLGMEPELAAQPASMPAPVASVEVEQRGDGTVLVISGEMPDPCHDVGEVAQRVENGEITVDVDMTPPEPDQVCAQVITPYTVEIPVEVRLQPGEYTVNVNGKTVDVTVK